MNTVVDAVREQVGLQHGVALPVWHALGSGGPRFDVTAAGALGVDRVFGTGTTPAEVASYLAHRLRTGWDR